MKYVGDIDIEEYNRQRVTDSRKNKAFAKDQKGRIHYMGVFENEIENDKKAYDRFKTMGAKKYVYELNGKLHITIAGVSKKIGAEELGSIENFNEGFTFYAAGGTESIFNDNVDMTVNSEGHLIRITDNIVIMPSTYTLGLTAEYKAILDGLADIKYSDHNIYGYYDAQAQAQSLNI